MHKTEPAVFAFRRRRQRALARGLRRRLPQGARDWMDREIHQVWNEHGDVGLAKQDLEATLKLSAPVYGFDPATVILMIRLGVLIFEALKALGYFQTTQEQLAAILETEADEEDDSPDDPSNAEATSG